MHGADTTGLSAAQIAHFIDKGFVRIDDAFPTELAAVCRERLWQAMGLSPDAPDTWTRPVVRLDFIAGPPFDTAANTPKLTAAYDALAGEGRWLRPAGLGSFVIRFPSDEEPGDTGWHVDTSFDIDNPDFMQWRCNVTSRGRALLMLFLLSDTGTGDAPTRICAGSHKDVARLLLPRGDAGMTLKELVDADFGMTGDGEEVLATGAAGAVYLCHPFLVHAAQAHHGRRPRFLAQPPLLPRMAFNPALPPSPVQTAIRQACGLTM